MKILSQKLGKFLPTIIGSIFALALFIAPPAFANDASGFTGRCDYLLGLTSWDCGVTINSEDTLKTGIWQIVANIAIDITVIAAYLVLGYVIYGGYQYMLARGDPSKVSAGKKTLVNAFIGLAIVMSAYVIMGAIRIALIGDKALSNCIEDSCINANTMIENLIGWVIGIAGVVCVVFILYGGAAYIISSGDPGKIKKARDTILYAVIGLIIVALASVITAFVSNLIREANNSAYLPPANAISKEFSKEHII